MIVSQFFVLLHVFFPARTRRSSKWQIEDSHAVCSTGVCNWLPIWHCKQVHLDPSHSPYCALADRSSERRFLSRRRSVGRLSTNCSGRGFPWILERFGFHEALVGLWELMIMAIGFSSNFVLSLGPAIAFYVFQLYRRVMLKGNERAAPPPGHSFVGGALANCIGESLVFPCPCQTRADMRRMKPSLCYTQCCSQRSLYKLLVNLIRPTILHGTHQYIPHFEEFIPLADSSPYTAVSGRSCSRVY